MAPRYRGGVEVRILIRGVAPPDDATVLLHFGDGSERAVRRVTEEIVDRHDYWLGVLDERGRLAVSVYALDGISEEGIARMMPHNAYGRSTAGRVRSAGFEIVGSTIDFDRMPPGLRSIQQWHSTVFLRLEGFAFKLAERIDVADSLIAPVRVELRELFGLFQRTPNQFRGS